MASIFKRNGAFYGTFNHAGKRFKLKLSTDRTTAKLLLSDAILKVERGELGLNRVLTSVTSAINDFLRHVLASHRPTTHARYRASLEHFSCFLSREKVSVLNDIGAETIEKYKIWRKTTPFGYKGSSKGEKRLPRTRTINVELTVLKAFFNYCVRIGKLAKSPASGIRSLKEDDLQPRRFLSNDESARLLHNCDPEFYPVAFFLLNTGCRRGEVQHLEWEDIDLEKRVIRIQAKTFWKPKSGERNIPITNSLAEVLSQLPKAGRFVFSDGALPRALPPKNQTVDKLNFLA